MNMLTTLSENTVISVVLDPKRSVTVPNRGTRNSDNKDQQYKPSFFKYRWLLKADKINKQYTQPTKCHPVNSVNMKIDI